MSRKCSNLHHMSRYWERYLLRGAYAIRCSVCKRFIGYVASKKQIERNLKIETPDGAKDERTSLFD